MASNDRDEMNRYVVGLSKELEEECCASMIHDNMDLSRMTVHAQQVKESHLRKKNREAKKVQGKGNIQVQSSSPSSEAPYRNRFYALNARGEQDISPNVVTGMLQAFSINVYTLLDPGYTLSLVTPLVSWKFDILPNVLVEPFLLCTPMGDLVVARRVYKKCPVMLPNRVTLADLVEL
ncbi:uncharacterized protein [Solanum lycopersicum]|uniref:uncharacterized protein n=1 Tax=Solanum lycopersicum TaxID=4081 RepID=UPI003749DA28